MAITHLCSMGCLCILITLSPSILTLYSKYYSNYFGGAVAYHCYLDHRHHCPRHTEKVRGHTNLSGKTLYMHMLSVFRGNKGYEHYSGVCFEWRTNIIGKSIPWDTVHCALYFFLVLRTKFVLEPLGKKSFSYQHSK